MQKASRPRAVTAAVASPIHSYGIFLGLMLLTLLSVCQVGVQCAPSRTLVWHFDARISIPDR